MSPHLDDETLAALVERKLDEAARSRVQVHIEQCEDCRELLGAMAGSYYAENPLRDPGVQSGEILSTASTLQADAPVAGRSPWTPPDSFDEYRLIKQLGQGAMGLVFLATDTALDRQVAIKFIADVEPDQASRERFLREARAIARLTHPNVVAVHRIGQVMGRPYLVSEFVKGQSLDKLALPIAWERALSIGIDLARGLSAAHQRGVLHRDIKPANAILAQDGSVKLLDFGLAKLLDSLPGATASSPDLMPVDSLQNSQSSTQQGTVLGTPLYMAPELWRGAPASPQSDLYALGALLYALLAGHSPFVVRSQEELRQRCQTEDPPPLISVNRAVNPVLGGLIDRCLRRDPGQRPESAQELARGLLAIQAAAGLGGRSWLRRIAVGLGLLGLGGLALGSYPTLRRWLRPSMIKLPAGSFTMGSTGPEIDAAYLWCRQDDPECPRHIFEREQPARSVQISPFWIDTTEVTTGQFAAWLNRLHQQHRLVVDTSKQGEIWVREGAFPLANLYPFYLPTYEIKYREADRRFVVAAGLERKPVRQVTWIGARRYCADMGKRLPTEAEWEYAARGTEGRRFPWGDSEPRCDGFVFALWAYEPVNGVIQKRNLRCANQWSGLSDVGNATQDVTPSGIHDLAGNAAEWVADRFEERYAPCSGPCQDPVVSADDEIGLTLRVFRGGSYSNDAVVTRTATRGKLQQNIGATDVGFRCARTEEGIGRKTVEPAVAPAHD